MGKSNYGQGTNPKSLKRSAEKAVPAKRQPVRTFRKSKKEEDQSEEEPVKIGGRVEDDQI